MTAYGSSSVQGIGSDVDPASRERIGERLIVACDQRLMITSRKNYVHRCGWCNRHQCNTFAFYRRNRRLNLITQARLRSEVTSGRSSSVL